MSNMKGSAGFLTQTLSRWGVANLAITAVTAAQFAVPTHWLRAAPARFMAESPILPGSGIPGASIYGVNQNAGVSTATKANEDLHE